MARSAATAAAVRAAVTGGRVDTEVAVACRPPSTEFTPNDPMFGIQWGLQRTNVPRAWEMARGSAAVTVAVIDEGVQLDHPDLLLHPQSWNASSDTPDGSPTGNHGTACAGIAAQRPRASITRA